MDANNTPPRDWNKRFDVSEWDDMTPLDRDLYLTAGCGRNFIPNLLKQIQSIHELWQVPDLLPLSLSTEQVGVMVGMVRGDVVQVRNAVIEEMRAYLHNRQIFNEDYDSEKSLGNLSEGRKQGVDVMAKYFTEIDDMIDQYEQSALGLMRTSTYFGECIESATFVEELDSLEEQLVEMVEQFECEFCTFT